MVFAYHKDAGKKVLTIEGEQYNHLFRSRRTKKFETLELRNLLDGNKYGYTIKEINRNDAKLELKSTESLPKQYERKIKIFMCVIEPKNIEKIIPFLNEMGVSGLYFIYCERSQRGYKLDIERLKKIAILSSEQCGRGDMMEFGVLESMEQLIESEQKLTVVDFCDEKLSEAYSGEGFIIGPEGGFSAAERELLRSYKTVGIGGVHILKAETAAVYIAAKLS